MTKINLDKGLIETIINKAEAYMKMPRGFNTDAAFGKATTDVLGENHSAWGQYKKIAEAKYKKMGEILAEMKRNELLEGAEEAALARRDAEVEEAEENNKDLLHSKGREVMESGIFRHTRK